MAIDSDRPRAPGPPRWDDPWWDPPLRRRRRWAPWRRHRRLAQLAGLVVGVGVGVGAGGLYVAHTARPRGVPAVVAQRPGLPGCGRYRAWWGMTLPAANYQPGEKVRAANRCLLSSFEDGRPAELIVTGGPDDIGHTSVAFYRVVGRHRLDVIWEDIPPSGPIEAAELTGCTSLSDDNGRLGADDCQPQGPTYS